jgi:hypothetical protein
LEFFEIPNRPLLPDLYERVAVIREIFVAKLREPEAGLLSLNAGFEPLGALDLAAPGAGAIVDQLFWAEVASGAPAPTIANLLQAPVYDFNLMLATLSRLQKFAAGVNWQGLSGARKPLSIAAPKGWISAGFVKGPSGLVWVSGAEKADSFQIKVDGKPISGHYHAYDCDSGKWIAYGTFVGALAIPTGSKSIAYALTK